MTMPGPTKTIELPPPGYPMLVLLVTDDLVPAEDAKKSRTISWLVSKRHPFVEGMNVVRMFIGRNGIEVYSASGDGQTGLRDLIPMAHVRLVQEAMPLDVFVEELAAAESGADEDDDVDFDDEAPASGAQQAPQAESSNGQVAT